MFINPENHLKFILVIILGSILIFSSCGTTQDGSNSNMVNSTNSTGSTEKKASDNISELLNIIRLPEIPEEVVWKEEPLGEASNRVPGPTDRKLTAIFRYQDVVNENNETDKIKTRLLELLEKGKKNGEVEIPTEDWFPEELIAQAQLSGNESIKGISYSASDFLNIPYGTGRITHILNTDYFILELYTT